MSNDLLVIGLLPQEFKKCYFGRVSIDAPRFLTIANDALTTGLNFVTKDNVDDASALVAPRIDDATGAPTPESPTTLMLDSDETYNLYQCLHTLFHPTTNDA